jgi:hypothetical protein
MPGLFVSEATADLPHAIWPVDKMAYWFSGGMRLEAHARVGLATGCRWIHDATARGQKALQEVRLHATVGRPAGLEWGDALVQEGGARFPRLQRRAARVP